MSVVSTHFTNVTVNENLAVAGSTSLTNLTVNQDLIVTGNTTLTGTIGIVNLTTLERTNLPNPQTGDLVYDTDENALFLWNGGWVELAEASGLVLTVSGTVNQVTSTGGTAPQIGLASNPIIPGVEGMEIPVGTTAQRSGTPRVGDIRFNTSIIEAEVYTGVSWKTLGGVGTGTVTSVGITTGSSGISLGGTNPVTSSGDISVDLNDD